MRFKTPFLAAIAGLLFSCEKLEKKEEIVYEGNTFGVENYSKTTLETTLRYRQIYLASAQSKDRKILVGFVSKEMNPFPVDTKTLNGDFMVFSSPEHYVVTPDDGPVADMTNTLYMDPSIFTKSEYQSTIDFIKANKEKFNVWLDSDVIGLVPGQSYYKINAVVYKKLSELEREYRASEGKDYVRILVNKKLYMLIEENGMATEGNLGYRLENDTLYYPIYEDKKKVERILTFKSRDGVAFSDKAKVIMPMAPN